MCVISPKSHQIIQKQNSIIIDQDARRIQYCSDLLPDGTLQKFRVKESETEFRCLKSGWSGKR